MNTVTPISRWTQCFCGEYVLKERMEFHQLVAHTGRLAYWPSNSWERHESYIHQLYVPQLDGVRS